MTNFGFFSSVSLAKRILCFWQIFHCYPLDQVESTEMYYPTILWTSCPFQTRCLPKLRRQNTHACLEEFSLDLQRKRSLSCSKTIISQIQLKKKDFVLCNVYLFRSLVNLLSDFYYFRGRIERMASLKYVDRYAYSMIMYVYDCKCIFICMK